MTEILTESFCERCGTRYTFESSAPRQKRLRGIKTLGRGLKNFVMSDDASLDEALAAARSDSERESTSMQLDAFHRTFNFCMSCRQYTCANCWNGPEARCLSCAPLALLATEPSVDEIDPARLLRFMAPAAETPDVAASAEAPWPEASLEGRIAPLDDDAAIPHVHSWVAVPAAEAAAEPAAEAAAEPAAEADAGPEAELALVEASEPEGVVSIGGLALGQTIEDAVAAYEATLTAPEPALTAPEPALTEAPTSAPEAPLAAAEPEAEPEPAVAVAATVIEAEPEPAAVIEPEPELAAAEPELAAVIEPEPERVDIVEQPTWATLVEPAAPAAEPATLPTEVEAPPAEPAIAVSEPAASIVPDAAPSWPTGPRWPTAIPSRQAPPPVPPAIDPLVALMSRHSTDAMWAASSRDVVQPPVAAQAPSTGVQPCVSCGISLSANARFCRRCGTQQG